MNESNQSRAILAHLRKGLSITAKDARRLFRCERLAARIFDLKEAGHDIRMTMEYGSGTRWARYTLIQEAKNATQSR